MIDFLSKADQYILELINHGLSNPVFDILMPVFEKSYFYMICTFIWVLLLLFDKENRFRLILLLLAVLVLTDQTGRIIKEFEFRERPWYALKGSIIHLGNIRTPMSSFPSNHAANATAMMLVLWSIYGRPILFGTIALIIIFSRIYIGMHYPSDTIAGVLIGGSYAMLVLGIYNRYNEYNTS